MSNSPVMSIVARRFSARDLVAGHPTLDFVNTVTARNAPDPVDWLDGYPRLIEWAQLSGIAAEIKLSRLRSEAKRSPAAAAAALHRAKEFREAFHSVCGSLFRCRAPSPDHLHELERMWRRTLARVSIAAIDGRLKAVLDPSRSGLDQVLDHLVLEGVELLRDLPLERARICEGERCGWLFIDSSKGNQRVWCDMATCGNAAKSRRFRASK